MKKIIQWSNKVLFYFRKNNLKHTSKLHHILVISNTALGDTILSTPVIRSLKKSFPNSKLTLMINKNLYTLFKDYEYIDELICYKKSFWGLLSHIWYIKRNKIDSLFFLHSNGPQDLFLALASKAEHIHKAINYPNKLSKEFSSLIVHKVHENKEQHIIEHRLDTIRYLNPKYIEYTLDLPKKYLTQTKQRKNGKIHIGIQLGAADIYKMWPLECFIQLINMLLTNPKIHIFLLGIEKESSLAQKVQQNTNFQRVLNYCGKTSIEELPNMVMNLDLLITNDTGTLHVAIALNVKTVSLFSPTSSKIFGPYQSLDKHIVIQKNGDFINNKPKKERDQSAMKLIHIDEVYAATQKQLEEESQCVG